jgi:ketosteroid isomerase-like protein
MARLKQRPSPLLATVLFSVLALGASTAEPTAEEKMNLLASGFQAFLGGDVATFVSMFAEDHVYIVEGGPELPWSGVTKVRKRKGRPKQCPDRLVQCSVVKAEQVGREGSDDAGSRESYLAAVSEQRRSDDLHCHSTDLLKIQRSSV